MLTRRTRTDLMLTLGVILAVALGLATGAGTAYAADGDLDPSFDGDGRATIDIGGLGNDRAYAVALQSDGKIIVAGEHGPGWDGYLTLARLNANGSPDTTFSGDGQVTYPIGDRYSSAAAVIVQPDGKIVAAGYSEELIACDPTCRYKPLFTLVRLNSNGDLDTSFNGDGIATIFGYQTGFAHAVVSQQGGKIVAAGHLESDFAVARFNTNGDLDTSFAGDGIAITDFGAGGVATAVAIQPDLKIVAAGDAHLSTGTRDYDFALARYNTDGSPDTTFGFFGIGWDIVDFFGHIDVANSLTLQPDGKIVAAGYAHISDLDVNFALIRVVANGQLDTSFDGDGRQTIDMGVYGAFEEARGVALQANGKIVAAGHASPSQNSDSEFALVRLNTDGSLDSSFGTGGTLYTDFTGQSDKAYAVAIQPDGRIVAVGEAELYTNFTYFGVARYLSSDVPPTLTHTSTPTPTLPAFVTSTPTPTLPAFVTSTPTSTPTPSLCNFTVTGSIDGDDPLRRGSIVANDPASTCGLPQTCSSSSSRLYLHDSYTFTNSGGSTCVTVTLQTSCRDLQAIHAAAYLNSFNPQLACTNYLADIGSSPDSDLPKSFSFTVPAGANVVVVVSQAVPINYSEGCPAYTLSVSADGPCQ